ncbi:MAG TPA: hypothetical protein VJH24_04960 [Candidatus Bilamarchaeaceae archaeon]|nr:hypothetical protein [Candidatus Bilamarchaeaceae archaeon]
MGVFVAANQRVEVAGKHTWLEAIHRGNTARKRIVPNSFYNRVLLDKDEGGRPRAVPREIIDSLPAYTGTFGMIGAKGRPFGDRVEGECDYAGRRKTVVVKPSSDETGLVDMIVTCDHGFAADGTSFLNLFNARTERPIRTDEEMGEADTILLNLNGQKRRYRIQDRNGGVLEAVGNDNTYGWISDLATLGLLRHGHGGFYGRCDNWLSFSNGRCSCGWRGVDLRVRPSSRFAVVREATDAVVASDNAPIVGGSKEQVNAAPELVRQPRQK